VISKEGYFNRTLSEISFSWYASVDPFLPRYDYLYGRIKAKKCPHYKYKHPAGREGCPNIRQVNLPFFSTCANFPQSAAIVYVGDIFTRTALEASGRQDLQLRHASDFSGNFD
jgi:hypothetical protein